MKRTGFRSKPIEAKASLPILRKRKCASCGESFRPFTTLVRWCSPDCGAALGMKKLKQAEKKQDQARKEKLKTRRDYIEEAQRAFNKFVRLRDAGRPCICCGRPLDLGAHGGGYDAGHYRSVGSAPHLRFHEDNCHAQSKQCNRYGAGRAVDYRIGLIDRIGIARVEALEADQSSPKWSIDDLKAIRDTYKAKAKELEKQ